jgi:hypothetical protein
MEKAPRVLGGLLRLAGEELDDPFPAGPARLLDPSDAVECRHQREDDLFDIEADARGEGDVA